MSDSVDVYVWEGASDIALRAERFLSGYDATVIHVDAAATGQPSRDSTRPAVALVSVTAMGEARFAGLDWLAAQGIPVIWVASEDRAYDPRYYPPAYSYTLPLSFAGADLRRLVFRLAGVSSGGSETLHRSPAPLVANSPVMRELLDEARMFADCRANVLIHGETGVGKERIAGLLHEASPWSRGPFVAVNCGAIPEGLFEAHFFGHAKGAFTGAVGAHKGYFEQASGGTLFLDEIGDLPLYQQVKLLRVLEQNTVTRLGSSVEIPVEFRLVAATNKSIRTLVTQGEFRSDLYYRLAVVELYVPNLEERGPAEKVAIFSALLARHEPGGEDAPPWLQQQIAALQYPGNVRELANLAERVAIIRRQFGDWRRDRIDQVLERHRRFLGVSEPQAPAPAPFSPAEKAERQRILAALEANDWRRQDTAHFLGISRKVLWEKMRKLRLGDAQAESVDGVAEL